MDGGGGVGVEDGWLGGWGESWLGVLSWELINISHPVFGTFESMIFRFSQGGIC